MAARNLTRRQFVTTTLTIGAGSVLLGKTGLGLPAESKDSFADPFQVVTLGKSGLKSTLLGMGTGFSGYNRSSNITRAGVAESIIRQAYEKGIRRSQELAAGPSIQSLFAHSDSNAQPCLCRALPCRDYRRYTIPCDPVTSQCTRLALRRNRRYHRGSTQDRFLLYR